MAHRAARKIPCPRTHPVSRSPGAETCACWATKGGGQGECEPAKHAPGAGPGKCVTGAGAHTASRKATEEGTVHLALPPSQRREAHFESFQPHHAFRRLRGFPVGSERPRIGADSERRSPQRFRTNGGEQKWPLRVTSEPSLWARSWRRG